MNVEYKEHKTKNSKNSKETSDLHNNMASKNLPVIDSIDFHVNKMAPGNDASESKNHVLLPFPYDNEDLPTHAAVSDTTTTTTINSTNNIERF